MTPEEVAQRVYLHLMESGFIRAQINSDTLREMRFASESVVCHLREIGRVEEDIRVGVDIDPNDPTCILLTPERVTYLRGHISINYEEEDDRR